MYIYIYFFLSACYTLINHCNMKHAGSACMMHPWNAFPNHIARTRISQRSFTVIKSLARINCNPAGLRHLQVCPLKVASCH